MINNNPDITKNAYHQNDASVSQSVEGTRAASSTSKEPKAISTAQATIKYSQIPTDTTDWESYYSKMHNVLNDGIVAFGVPGELLCTLDNAKEQK